jgi:hypothetical protein
VADRRPILHDQLDQVRQLDKLEPTTPVERRPTVISALERRHDGAALVFEGKELRFPAKATAAVEAVHRAAGPLAPVDLPGPLDLRGRHVLVHRLVREGFLRVAYPAIERR